MEELRKLLARVQGEYAETNRHIAMRLDSINQLRAELLRLRALATVQEEAIAQLRALVEPTEQEGGGL